MRATIPVAEHHQDMVIFKLLAPIFLLLVAYSTSHAETLREVFDNNRPVIVSNSISIFSDFVFVRGTVSMRRNASHRDYSRAQLNAVQKLIDYIYAESRGQTHVEQNSDYARLRESLKVKLKGIQVVERYRSGEQTVVVIALPAAEVKRTIEFSR